MTLLHDWTLAYIKRKPGRHAIQAESQAFFKKFLVAFVVVKNVSA